MHLTKGKVLLTNAYFLVQMQLQPIQTCHCAILYHIYAHITLSRRQNAWSRLQRWSFFWNDGMVIFFFQGTIAIDGFSMVLPALDHHHWMFFYWSTIDIDGFPMVFPNSGAMVSNGFNLERDLKMRVIVSASIFNSSDQQVLSWIFKDTLDQLLLINFRCK